MQCHGSQGAGPSWPPYDATSRRAPACCSSLVRPASARPGSSPPPPSPPNTFVAVGHCLPLSGEIPLLPIADCIRTVREDDARGFSDALSGCPPYVTGSLATLVPEVGPGSDEVRTEDRGLLFSALVAVLRAVAERGRLALLVEDMHWSDPTTLDFIEHMIGRLLPIPVLGTWRSGDLGTPDSSDEWRARVALRPETTVLALGPLTRHETSEQLALLGADAHARLDTIHARSQGLPLFTEQLAAHLDEEAGLPILLADLLDHRLQGLSEHAWSVMRGLGVAERALPPCSAGSGEWSRPGGAHSRPPRAPGAPTPPVERGRAGAAAAPPACRSRATSPRGG